MNLIYKIVFNKIAKETRYAYNSGKKGGKITEFLPDEALKPMTELMNDIAEELNAGKKFPEIRDELFARYRDPLSLYKAAHRQREFNFGTPIKEK